MVALRLRAGVASGRDSSAARARDSAAAAAIAAITALLALAAVHRFGVAGVLAPFAVVAALTVLSMPRLAMGLLVGLTVACEGPDFGLFSFSSHLYDQAYKDVSILDLLVALAMAAVALDVVRSRRSFWIPRQLALPLATLALAMVAGVITGHAAGASLRFAVFSEHVLAYLLLIPLAVCNLDVDRRDLQRVLAIVTVFAIVKAVLGLIEVRGHYGLPIEGRATLTYYEPTSNWLTMIVLLGIVAALLSRAKVPLWALLGSPLLIACLILSYRRSFWIGAVLGLLLVLLFATTPAGRRLLVPASLGVVVAIWLLGSVNFQSSQSPVVKRIASLTPSHLETNVQDRYRLDERANVLAEISEHPLTGIGVTIPWQATAQPLSVEHEEGRSYVHFAALWFWLKLGILGLCAYIGMILAGMSLAWRAWRRSPEPLMKAFALASLCGTAGLIAIETTASFTGVDARFTVLFAAQLGLLALMGRTAEDPPPVPGSPANASIA